LSQSGGIPPYDSEDSYEKREEKEGDEETTKGTGFAGEEEVQWEREILERLQVSHRDFCHQPFKLRWSISFQRSKLKCRARDLLAHNASASKYSHTILTLYVLTVFNIICISDFLRILNPYPIYVRLHFTR
jgi:hypothetical protein